MYIKPGLLLANLRVRRFQWTCLHTLMGRTCVHGPFKLDSYPATTSFYEPVRERQRKGRKGFGDMMETET